jgi:predicted permease
MFTALKHFTMRLRAFFRRDDLDRDFEQELDSHVAMLTEDNVQRGMTREEARRAALIRVGASASIQDQHREARGLPALEAVLQDLRFAFRLLVKDRWVSAAAIVVLALAIGANTAIFSVVDRVVLRAVPFPEPDKLVVVWETNPNLPVPVMVASAPTLHDWQTRNRSFEAIGAFQWRSVTLSSVGEPEQIRGAAVTAPLLRALAVQPQLGRLFRDEEDRADAPPVVLISDGLWRRRFAASHSVLGQRVSINGVSRQIVGVMPSGYEAPPPVVFRGQPPADRAELWIPLAIDLAAGQRTAHNLTVIARLQRGATVETADSDVKRIAAEVAHEHPDYRDWNARVVPLRGWVTESSRRSMVLLTGSVGFILLLACANIANLLLARGVGRRREFAIRTALGAGRKRLAMQVIAESLALALIGCMAGVGLASGLIRLIVTRGPATIPGVSEAALDMRALMFGVAISLASAILAGVLPALHVVSARLTDWLTDRSAGPGHAAIRVQKMLVVGQIAFAMALLVSASLLVESFRQLRAVDPGFRPEHVMTGKVILPASRYANNAARIAFLDRLLSSARGVHGISAVGVSDAVPLADNRQGTFFVRAEVPVAPEALAASTANFAYVTEGYFEALGMRLVDGRTFTERDTSARPGVVIINERLARLRFGNENPIGRRVRVGVADQTTFEVVGIVADDHHVAVDAEPTPTFFVPFRHTLGPREIAVIARGEGDATQIVTALRSAIRALDPEMPFYRVQTMEQIVDTSVATPRSLAWLLSSFGLSGLLLAAIGVYAVLSQGVSQRTPEIGVRMAIGATPEQVLRMVLGEGLMQVGLGIMAGTAIAVGMTRLLSGLLFGVTTSSVTPYFAVAALLTVVTTAACIAPARRAMKVDPVRALRAE